jgi:glycosyltransferase domain-containing protein
MNRSGFVVRLLEYYANANFPGCIAIGDSSNAEHRERTLQAVARLKGRLDVVYVHYPGTGVGVCVQKLLEHVSTPYAATLPDDDFLVPASLRKCAEFLAEHLGYAAAHGVGITVNLDSNDLHGRVTDSSYYVQPVLEADTAAQRIDDHLGDYRVSLFSVHRLETWRSMLRDVHRADDVTFGAELLPCCQSAVAGKIAQLDCLYVVRQNHGLRYELPDAFDWLLSPKWLGSCQLFLESLSTAVAEKDGIAIEDARAVAKRAFKQYLVLFLGVRRRWNGAPWTLAAARGAKRLLTTFKPKEHSEFELAALLNHTSRYHHDFMPVYEALMASTADDLGPTVMPGKRTTA